jgi:hypothetical protein
MKRKRIIIGIFVLALVAAILIPTMLIPRLVTGKIVVIPLSGTITTDGSSSLSGSTITPGLVRHYLMRVETEPGSQGNCFPYREPWR